LYELVRIKQCSGYHISKHMKHGYFTISWW